MNAAYGGAREVLAVDASELAIEQARENARLNHFEDRVTFQVADVFDFLPALRREKKSSLMSLSWIRQRLPSRAIQSKMLSKDTVRSIRAACAW